MDWNSEAQEIAFSEGWGIFDSDTYGVSIQRDDDQALFADDDAAIAHVEARAAGGSTIHQQALEYIKGSMR